MIIIGERINSSRERIAEAIEKKDAEFIQREAIMQAEAGADYLDLNAGIFINREIEYLEWLIRVVQGATQTKLKGGSYVRFLTEIKNGSIDRYGGNRYKSSK